MKFNVIILAFIYEQKNHLVATEWWEPIKEFVTYVDTIYRDVTTNDLITNIKKYVLLLKDFLIERYSIIGHYSKS